MAWIPKRIRDIAFDSYEIGNCMSEHYRYKKVGYDSRVFKFLRPTTDYDFMTDDKELRQFLEDGYFCVSVSFGKNIPLGNKLELRWSAYARDTIGERDWGFEKSEAFTSEDELVAKLLEVLDMFGIEVKPFNSDDIWIWE